MRRIDRLMTIGGTEGGEESNRGEADLSSDRGYLF